MCTYYISHFKNVMLFRYLYLPNIKCMCNINIVYITAVSNYKAVCKKETPYFNI